MRERDVRNRRVEQFHKCSQRHRDRDEPGIDLRRLLRTRKRLQSDLGCGSRHASPVPAIDVICDRLVANKLAVAYDKRDRLVPLGIQGANLTFTGTRLTHVQGRRHQATDRVRGSRAV